VRKLQATDFDATYVDTKTWPEVTIHERGNPKNKLLTIRMKVENKPNGIYVRNYIEKGKLLEELTEYKRGALDSTAKVGTDDLDAVTNAPRLKGPGAKIARSQTEPKTDVGTLGRARR
jgi:hypothetical protein